MMHLGFEHTWTWIDLDKNCKEQMDSGSRNCSIDHLSMHPRHSSPAVCVTFHIPKKKEASEKEQNLAKQFKNMQK